MTHREVLSAVVAALRATGATPELPPVRGGRCHAKLWFSVPGGGRRFVSLPSTPGDRRTLVNCCAQARRLARSLQN